MTACDATAAGTEPAAFVVYTRHGKLHLCRHHYRRHRYRFLTRGYLVLPDTVPLTRLPHLSRPGLRTRLAALAAALRPTPARTT